MLPGTLYIGKLTIRRETRIDQQLGIGFFKLRTNEKTTRSDGRSRCSKRTSNHWAV